MKGFDVLLDACAILRKHVHFRCVVVGRGPEKDRLESLAASHGLESMVEFKTGLPQSELVQLYQDCHLYVQPCRRMASGMQDGIPATLMEAMAVAKPVVSTRVSGIPELIEDGVEGRLVASEDPVALGAALLDLTRDPEAARRMGLAGRSKIEREFDIATSARQLAKRLREVLARARDGAVA
jgi:glycosyltransferase involved in cell wall biosynthesis